MLFRSIGALCRVPRQSMPSLSRWMTATSASFCGWHIREGVWAPELRRLVSAPPRPVAFVTIFCIVLTACYRLQELMNLSRSFFGKGAKVVFVFRALLMALLLVAPSAWAHAPFDCSVRVIIHSDSAEVMLTVGTELGEKFLRPSGVLPQRLPPIHQIGRAHV